MKASAGQPPTWKRWVSGAATSRIEVVEPLKADSEQSVGLRVKSGLESCRVTERTSSGIPSRIVGIGSETAWIWVVSGST